jgi:hypothetical protein
MRVTELRFPPLILNQTEWSRFIKSNEVVRQISVNPAEELIRCHQSNLLWCTKLYSPPLTSLLL